MAVVGENSVVASIGVGPQAVDPRFNTLQRLSRHSSYPLGDIQAYVSGHPDLTDIDQPPNPTDSNPYSVAAVGGGRYLVSDAANNSLLMVERNGRVSTVARFPNEVVPTGHLPFPFPAPAIPAEAVPTAVAIGPDGYAYVAELKGFPFAPGTSRIWRVSTSARDVTCDPSASTDRCAMAVDGLTSVTGLAVGRDGSLYVVSMVKNGLFGFIGGGDTDRGPLPHQERHRLGDRSRPAHATRGGRCRAQRHDLRDEQQRVGRRGRGARDTAVAARGGGRELDPVPEVRVQLGPRGVAAQLTRQGTLLTINRLDVG